MSDASNLTAEQTFYAKNFFGYGRWEAAHWFIGPEPGGDDLDDCTKMWNEADRRDLIDIARNHESYDPDWFGDNSRPQPTWMRLIWLLQAFKEEKTDAASTLAYQRKYLGRDDGESALIELSALPATNTRVDVQRMLFRKNRTRHIASRLREHRPKIAILYSLDRDCYDSWTEIAGRPLIREMPIAVGPTAVVLVSHPNGKWNRSYWTGIGDALRRFLSSLG